MALERQEYPALLVSNRLWSGNSRRLTRWQDSLEPEQAVDLLNGRVAMVNKIHSDIADWLQVGQSVAASAVTYEMSRKGEELKNSTLRLCANSPVDHSRTMLQLWAFSRIHGSA